MSGISESVRKGWDFTSLFIRWPLPYYQNKSTFLRERLWFAYLFFSLRLLSSARALFLLIHAGERLYDGYELA
jgi:hypothetical protein